MFNILLDRNPRDRPRKDPVSVITTLVIFIITALVIPSILFILDQQKIS
jgi:hypothetical protein